MQNWLRVKLNEWDATSLALLVVACAMTWGITLMLEGRWWLVVWVPHLAAVLVGWEALGILRSRADRFDQSRRR